MIEYSNALEVALSLTLNASDFPILLIPATFKPGKEAPFTMEVISDYPIDLLTAPEKRPPGFDKKLAAERKAAERKMVHRQGKKKTKKKKQSKVGNGGVSLMGAKKSQTQVMDMYAGLA